MNEPRHLLRATIIWLVATVVGSGGCGLSAPNSLAGERYRQSHRIGRPMLIRCWRYSLFCRSSLHEGGGLRSLRRLAVPLTGTAQIVTAQAYAATCRSRSPG